MGNMVKQRRVNMITGLSIIMDGILISISTLQPVRHAHGVHSDSILIRDLADVMSTKRIM